MTVDDLDVTIDFVKENAVVSKESRSSYTFLHGIKVTYRKPFDLFARATETGEWRGVWDEFRNYLAGAEARCQDTADDIDARKPARKP